MDTTTPTSGPKRATVMMTIRCTPDFRSRFKAWARSRGESMEGAAFRLCADAMRADTDAGLVAAARAVMEWYDRDGSVGGLVDPIEALRAALAKAH